MAPRWPVRTAAAKKPVRGQDALLRYHAKMSKSLSFCFLMSFSNLELCQLVLTSLTEENTKTPCWTKGERWVFWKTFKNASICESLKIAHGAKHGVVRQLFESKWMGMSPKPKRKPLNCPCSSIFDTLFKKETAQCLEGLQIVPKPMLRKWAFHEGMNSAIMGESWPPKATTTRKKLIINLWSPPSSSTTRCVNHSLLSSYLILFSGNFEGRWD